MTAAVEVDGLVRRFGAVTAVDGVDFTLTTGSLLALIGPNGAGKTTTVEICEGFDRPDAGTVRVLGLDPWRDAAALRPRIGIMLQSSGVHLAARTREMLRLVAACSANPHDPDWLLDLFGLTSVAQTPVRRLSGGQVQRLSLAMALVGRPELLFLDEPTAGLDPQARHLVWEVLSAARADGATVLLTTHAMDEAEQLADEVVLIDAGRVVAAGSVAELVGDEGWLEFTAEPGVDVSRLAAPGSTVRQTAPGRYLLSGLDTARLIALVTGWSAEQGVVLRDVQTGRRRLEDVFLELTGQQVRA